MTATDTTQRPGRWHEVYRRWLERPEELWAEAAAEIDRLEPWDRVPDRSRAPVSRWFAGARLTDRNNIRRDDRSAFRALFLGGERCDPDTLRWA